MSVTILMKNVEADNNPLNESQGSIYDENVRVENIGPEKRVQNIIFLILLYGYNNNGFL